MRYISTLASFALAAAITFSFSPHAQAQDAGCGLGSLILKENSKLFQLLALTTNNSTATQFFGITTGTSGCRASAIVMNEKAIQYFAEVNKDELSREMAQGQGEKLATLASLYGCHGEYSQSFSRMTQSAFGRIVPNAETSVTEMVHNIASELNANQQLSQNCKAIL